MNSWPKSYVGEAVAKAGKESRTVVLEVAACDGGHAGRVTLPMLSYAYKETSLNEQGKKVMSSSALTAQAVNTFGLDGMTITVGNDGLATEKKRSGR